MRKNVRIALLGLVLAGKVFGQSWQFVRDDGIIGPLHQANIGKIAFFAKPVPLAQLSETDFLTAFELTDSSDLDIRGFLERSLINELHKLAPDLSVDELGKGGNFQFTFYVDGRRVYSENLHPGAGTPDNKKLRTVFRVPLVSTTGEDSWGRFLWTRFMANGGEEALEEGKHQLKIEIRPYIKLGIVKVGDVIAHGRLELIIKKPQVSESRMAVQPIGPNSGWTRSRERLDEDKLRELNRKIADGTFKDITSVVVIKGGKLLIEEYFNGAGRGTLHDTRSVGKTFASALTGIIVRDRYIKGVDQKLSDFYDLRKYENYDAKKAGVTIHDLLTMSSGFDGFDFDEGSKGNEENMYPRPNWVNWTLDLPMASRNPGDEWAYFTAGVVVLGDILHRHVPGGLEKYAARRLFTPLGIRNYKWQYTPQKVANTAGSLQMSALDLARFGQLYQNEGRWKGKQVIPAQWVRDSLTKHYKVPGDPDTSYGYLWWNKTYKVGGKDHEAWYCSGNGGNKIFVFRDIPAVVVITATAYGKPYGHPQVDKMMERYILKAISK